MLPLEAQFANFGPVERVDLCIALQGQTQWLQRDGASEGCGNTMGQELSPQDTGREPNSQCCQGLGKGCWGLVFDPPLHQLVLKVEIEVQGLSLPPEAVCVTPGSQDKPHRGGESPLARLKDELMQNQTLLSFAGQRGRAQLPCLPTPFKLAASVSYPSLSLCINLNAATQRCCHGGTMSNCVTPCRGTETLSALWESPDFNGLPDALITHVGCLWL